MKSTTIEIWDRRHASPDNPPTLLRRHSHIPGDLTEKEILARYGVPAHLQVVAYDQGRPDTARVIQRGDGLPGGPFPKENKNA